MQKKISFWVPLIIVCIFAGSGALIYKFARANELIKQRLLIKVRPFLDQGTEIQKLDFSWSHLHLQGVKLAPKDRSFFLEIEDVKIGYSIWNLVRYGFNPNRMAHDVTLLHPILTVKKHSEAKKDSIQKKDSDSYKKTIDAFETIQRFIVSEAEFRMENTVGQAVILTQRLNGYLRTHPLDSADIHLMGCLFDSKKQNIRLYGKVNLLMGTLIELKADVEESELSQEIPLLMPGLLEIQSGQFRAFVHFDSKYGTRGFFQLQRGFVSLKKVPLQFDDVNFLGSIADSNLIFHGSVQRFNGSRLTVSGKIHDLFNPQLNVLVSCPKFDLSAFFTQLSSKIHPIVSGDAQFTVRLSGSYKNPSVLCRFSSNRFQLYGMPVYGMESQVHLKDSVLVIEGGNNVNRGVGISINGKMDLSHERKMSLFSAEIKGDFLQDAPEWMKKRIDKCQGNLTCQFEGEYKNMIGQIQGKILVHPMEGLEVDVYPSFVYQNNKFRVSLSSDRAFKISGEVLNPFQKDIQWNVAVHGAEWLFGFVPEVSLSRLSGNLQVQGFFNGTPKEWFFETNGIQPARYYSQVFWAQLNSKTWRKNRRDFEFNANYFGPTGEVLESEAHFSLTSKELMIHQCKIGNWFNAQGQIPFDRSDVLKAELRIDNFVFEKLHVIFPALKPFWGRIDARLRFEGARDTLSSRLEVSLNKGKFHDVDGFDGEIFCDWAGKVFRSGSIDFRKNDIPLLAGNFSHSNGDSVTGKIQSGSLQFAELTQALTGRKNILKGEGIIDIGIRGPGRIPVLSGRVRIRNGSARAIPFSEFSAEITDTLQDQSGLAGGVCLIRNGFLLREDGFKVEFWGNVPHGKTKTGDFSILAKGDMLGILADANALFRKAKGTGEIFMKFKGNPGSWAPSSGWIKLDKGELELSSIVKKVEKLQGEARLIEGSSFLQISRLSGQIDGGMFVLNNIQNKELTPLVFPKLGIDFGVLCLFSQGKGIPFHFPGLMESGEQGWIGFSGLKKSDPFFITGPISSPGFAGTLTLNDDRITYPFLDTGGSGPKFTFFNKVQWNLRVIPNKDVHYIRNIESPFGNVFLDLQMQDGNGELRFEGVIRDKTFKVWGNLVSTDGTIEVLDRYFKPERITFDYPRGANPILSGRAYTILTDSTGVQSTIWLNLVTADQVTGFEEKGGTLGKVHFKFSTDNPNLGRTEADLLAALGYSTQEIKNRAYDAVGMQVDNYFFRPLFRPIERGLRRYLGLDMVRFSSMFGRNLIQLREIQPVEFDPRWLLRSTKVTVGKYLAPGLILTYSGEIQNEYGYWLHTNGIGLKHSLSLEYSIRPDLFLEMEYFYDSRLLTQRREDTRIWFRHVFPF